MKKAAASATVEESAAREAVLLWRAFEPAYEYGPDAVTHSKLLPRIFGEHA